LLKQIVQQSSKLITFIALLQLNLSKPQREHVQRIADAVIVSEQHHKTLSSLYELILDAPDPSNAADCLRISPWQAEDIREMVRAYTLRHLLEHAQRTGSNKIFVSVDDSLSEKDKATRHIEPVAYHHDHTKSGSKKQQYSNGAVHVGVRLQVGQAEYSYDHRLYLRRKTVRRLNRQRPVGQRLRFRTKYHLAREMLADLKSRLPKGYQLYVLCDSWYSSRKLLNFCRRQGWHLIGAVKSNRTLDGTKLSQWHKQLKHQRYTRVKHSTATDRKKKRTYFLRQRQGKFNHVSFPVCVFISKRHPGDKRPKYLVSTDCSLSARTVLAYYQKRWAIEVDHLYLKQFLGLADFRVQSFEAVEKWFAIVFLALAYLQWRFNQALEGDAPFASLAEVIRLHRQEHAQQLLRFACHHTLDIGQVEPVLARFSL
jgi:hypothetical protein